MAEFLLCHYFLRIEMSYEIVEFNEKFADSAVGIWNQVVGQGNAFPQEEPMTIPQGIEFFNFSAKSDATELKSLFFTVTVTV